MSVTILGIETSCDETAAAVVRNGTEILSNVVLSQINDHAAFGGVVPEVASRKHLEAIIPVVDEALAASALTLDDIDAVAATYGPGLVGALLVGLSFAKALARAKNIPLIGVHHVAAHILAASLCGDPPEPPFTALVVSGGHSSIYYVENYRSFRLIGRTRDDAAGEAFDKVARATGLGYPGGQRLEAAAAGGDPEFIRFPRTVFRDGSYDFSFSGVKTAAINYLKKTQLRREGTDGTGYVDGMEGTGDMDGAINTDGASPRRRRAKEVFLFDENLSPDFRRDFYASYQAAVTDALVINTLRAEKDADTGKIVVAGGVAANGALRERFQNAEAASGGRLNAYFPPPALCTDNAAMVAARAYHEYAAGAFSPLTLNASPTANL
jgi:N6-L-threonylcarbamoyladenine synthase